MKLFEKVTDIDLRKFGIYPKEASGLIGVFASPFLHADWNHLISNSIPFLILGVLILYSYRKVAFKAFLFIWFASGFMVWLTGRPSYHIGASNLVYGFAFFIFFSGIFRKDIQSIVLSLFVVFVYGSIVWGIFPIKPDISWEGHLMGAASGTFIAFIYRKVDLPPPVEYDEDEEDDDSAESQLGEMLDDLKINYEIIEKEKK
ncbi:MAG: rhomboid family intramembrane serine protease [Fimbriimonadaceae bacterium]|nr:rhomboid family intramembrane serine protease [Chitinophagales bacterium]